MVGLLLPPGRRQPRPLPDLRQVEAAPGALLPPRAALPRQLLEEPDPAAGLPAAARRNTVCSVF